MEAGVHQIGEVAKAVGLSLRTIRHYDEEGVVVPSGRSAGGFRLYTDQDIDRLRQVKRMRPLDLSLDEIRDLLETRDQLAAGTGDSVLLIERLSLYAALVHERCERLQDQLAKATELLQSLQRETRAASLAHSQR